MSKNDLLATAMLAEYKALREEVARILERQYSIANWAISSIAIIVAALANSWDKLINAPLFLLALFYFVIPALVTAYVVTWSHIIIKMARIGAHLFLVERKVSVFLGGRPNPVSLSSSDEALVAMPLAWEHSLWISQSHEFIFRTMKAVRWTMAGLYFLVCSIGTVIALWSGSGRIAVLLGILIHGALGVPYAFWGITWFLLFRYISDAIDKAVRQQQTFAAIPQSVFADWNDKQS